MWLVWLDLVMVMLITIVINIAYFLVIFFHRGPPMNLHCNHVMLLEMSILSSLLLQKYHICPYTNKSIIMPIPRLFQIKKVPRFFFTFILEKKSAIIKIHQILFEIRINHKPKFNERNHPYSKP